MVAPRANMVSVNRTAANTSATSPRRFILLPEDPAEGAAHGPRIRRYKLTAVGTGVTSRHAGVGSAEFPTAGIARGLGRLGQM